MVEGSLESYEGVECKEINFIQNFQNFRGLGAPKPLFWGHWAQILKKHIFRHILVNNYGMTMVEGSLEAYENTCFQTFLTKIKNTKLTMNFTRIYIRLKRLN